MPVMRDAQGNMVLQPDADLVVVEALERLASSPDWETYVAQLRGNWEFEQRLLELAQLQRAGDWVTDDYLRGVIFGLKLAYSLPVAVRRRYNEKREQERLEAEMDAEGGQNPATPGSPPFRDSPIPEGAIEEGDGKWA